MIRHTTIEPAHLAYVAILMSLTVVLPGLQAQNSSPNAASSVSVPRPILTAAQVKKLASIAKADPPEELPASFTAALGPSKGDQLLTLPTLFVQDPPDLAHAYILLPDGGTLLVVRDREDNTCSYRLNSRQELVAAVITRQDAAPVVIPMPVAERKVGIEVAYWVAALKDWEARHTVN